MLPEPSVQRLLEDAHPRGHQKGKRQRADTYKTEGGTRDPRSLIARDLLKEHFLLM